MPDESYKGSLTRQFSWLL